MALALDNRPDSDRSTRLRQIPPQSVRRLVLLALVWWLGGCAMIQPNPGGPPPNDTTDVTTPAAATAGTPADQPAAAQSGDIWGRLRRGFRLAQPTEPRVDAEIARLQRSPKSLQHLLRRAEPFLHHILNAVETADLPSEIALLPAVESGFRSHAHSRDGAAGLWQFMPATAQMMGLERNWWFDGRRTVRASTAAALEYLGRLNARFDGDWLLALAAYNAGAGKVARAIRQADGHADYWSLDLPRETDVYVPRLLALTRIVANPDAYGIDLPEIADEPYFHVASTAGQIDLGVAAELAQLPVEELLALNAGHRRWATAPDGPHELLIPVDRVDTFTSALSRVDDDQRLRWQRYRVQPGDSLIRIARRFDVPVEAVKRSNGLRDGRIRAGEALLIPLSDSLASVDTTSNGQSRQRLHYRVRSGDSLYRIAQRYQVSVTDLRRWNRVGRYIRPGERLTLYIDPDA